MFKTKEDAANWALDQFNKYSGNINYQDANVQLDRLRWQDKMSDEDFTQFLYITEYLISTKLKCLWLNCP